MKIYEHLDLVHGEYFSSYAADVALYDDRASFLERDTPVASEIY